MSTAAVYPDNTIAPSIETIFVDGYKFDICEFIKEAREEFAVSNVCRFFLTLEDELLPFRVPTTEAVNAFGEYNVWGRLLCADKAYWKSFIVDFENDLKAVFTWKERAAKSPVFTARYNERKSAFEKRWGVK